MTEVHALSDYRLIMDDYNSKSLPYKKDDIKCNNFNLNANGLNVNTIPEPLSSLLQTQAETEEADISTGTLGNGENRWSYDKDFSFVCVNNNDNQVVISPTPPNPPPPPPPCEVTVDTITGLGDLPIGIAYDPENERMYVTNVGDDTVSVINLC